MVVAAAAAAGMFWEIPLAEVPWRFVSRLDTSSGDGGGGGGGVKDGY
jgi:hypothetical protein